MIFVNNKVGEVMDILIVGAGNHSKVVIDILSEYGKQFNVLGLLDDNKDVYGQFVLGKRILGEIEHIRAFDPTSTRFVISIGNNQIRRQLFDKITKWGYLPANVISKYASVSEYTKLGNGLIINAGVRIHPDVLVDDNVIVGMNATISHDSVIEKDVHISPGVHITGAVYIETGVDIGTGAVILPGVRVGRDSIIGAGAVVTKDIPSCCTAVGVPARPKFDC